MGGTHSERQERRFIEIINETIANTVSLSVNIRANCVILPHIQSAEKYTGTQLGGSEPYTDVILRSATETYRLSLKGTSALSLGGGGLRGLELIVPGLARQFLESIYDEYLMDFHQGELIPNAYGLLDYYDQVKIIIGNDLVGGPIDYLYIGPMTVKGDYDTLSNTLELNGSFHDSVSYAGSRILHFRLRARRRDQRFDPFLYDKHHIPRIYGISPSHGDSGGRLVITDQIPSNARMIAYV